MKFFITSVLLIVASFARAQIVNIPDSNFKKYLTHHIYPVFDLNTDGEIQESEAEAVIEIGTAWSDIDQNSIHDLTGIKAFKNLKKLTWGYSKQSQMDISGLDQLHYLLIINDSLSAINLSGCIKLDTVEFQGNKKLQFIDFSVAMSLKSLILGQNGLRHYNLGIQDSLRYFDMHDEANLIQKDTLDLSPYKNLRYVFLWQTSFKYANLSNLTELTGISTAECDSLRDIRFNGCIKLSSLNIQSLRNLYNLDLSNCISLTSLWTESMVMESLDVSSCYKLTSLSIAPYALKKLNMKNGIFNTLQSYPLFGTCDICVDEFEVESLRNQFAFVYEDHNVTPYCSFFPGGLYNTIKGNVRIGSNSTCNSADRPMFNVPIKITDTSGNIQVRYSAPNGGYGYYPFKGIFTLSPYFPYQYFIVNPSTASVTFDTANSLTATRDFCILPNGTHNDLEITLLPVSPVRPGFDAYYSLAYRNGGTTTLSGNVQVNFDNTHMTFVGASENVTTQSSGHLLWNYNNLQPFESRTINVTFNLLPPPVNNIGDTVSYLAVITPSDNDETAFDNIFILPQRIIGSYDPNDKQCLEGSKLDISKIGDYLHYQIRFQNEGTDTAFNIVVADTLSNNLDWNTFEFIGSSHTADVKLTNNKLEFFFQNINLPYKAIDEPGSNGWVAFKIKPKPSIVIGDSINNTASIYFDFNFPVITNTATTVVTNSSGPVPVKLEYFSANKKDNSNQLNWKASCTYGNATFVIERSNDGIHFSSIGNINATSLRCQLPFNFIDNNPVGGKNYYRLKIIDVDGISFYSKVLVVGNNKAGLEIAAVVNNTVYLNSNKQQTITMRVIAADGRIVYADRKKITEGSNQITTEMKHVPKGIYALAIYADEGEIITRRFVK